MVSSSTLSVSLILFLSFSSFFSPSQSHNNKVSLELYYESLCPYSANFIVNYLPKIFKDDLISIVDLNLVPWGNAKLRGNSTFDCQVHSLYPISTKQNKTNIPLFWNFQLNLLSTATVSLYVFISIFSFMKSCCWFYLFFMVWWWMRIAAWSIWVLAEHGWSVCD